jgi:hypothetical protein
MFPVVINFVTLHVICLVSVTGCPLQRLHTPEINSFYTGRDIRYIGPAGPSRIVR